MVRLTGSHNPIIKEIRSLKNRNDREEKGLYFIEGDRFVDEALALREKVGIRYVLVSDSFLADDSHRTILESLKNITADSYIVPDSLFAAVSDTRTPQGILAVLEIKRLQLKDAAFAGGLVVILEDIKDPGNMGAIIRTADAAGCECVIVPDGCVDVYNPKVLRSTMGSAFHIPILHCGGMEEAAGITSSNAYKLYASHLEGAVSIYDADFTGRIALVIGNEAQGISPETEKKSDLLIKIPMAGGAESLNASVAAGVMIFEAIRQRLYR